MKTYHDILANKAKPLVTIKQVRRQLEIMEAAMAQNPLPKKGNKHASITKGGIYRVGIVYESGRSIILFFAQ